MKNFELVIFDCDGVLVDSEGITNRVFAAMLKTLGLSFTLEDMFAQFVGKTMDQCLERITQLLGRPVPPGFVDEYVDRRRAALEQELRPVADIEFVLDNLDIPYCVASNGSEDKMRTTLGITGLLSRFEGRMFSAADVAQGKPAPDLFLHAAAKSNAAATASAVIEDTVTGVKAGVAAGMTVFAYSALTPSQNLKQAGAHFVFSAMSELPGLLLKSRRDT